MNRDERRERRQKDTKNAALDVAIFVLILTLLAAGSTLLAGKYLRKDTGKPSELPQVETETESELKTNDEGMEAETTEQDAPQAAALEQQAAELVAEMTLEERVAQMFVITPNALTGYASVTAAGDTTKEAYNNRPVGGIIYMSDNLVNKEQTAVMLSNMQTIAQERTGLPAFLCVDEEGGSVARIASQEAFGVTNVGDMGAVGAAGDLSNARQVGTVIGTYLTELGFNVDFAPVADVRTNEKNTVIGDRAFGSDGQLVADMVAAELEGMKEVGIYGTVKHFPGHGGTAEDSHAGAAVTEKTLEELQETELIPFQKAIDAGVSFVMVGHISVPNVTGDNTPATLSKTLVTDVLREQMGYEGIIITDAMNMGAITDNYNSGTASVMAVEAGADMILMPADYQNGFDAVLKAVLDGRITEERINASVTRIVKVKFEMMQAAVTE